MHSSALGSNCTAEALESHSGKAEFSLKLAKGLVRLIINNMPRDSAVHIPGSSPSAAIKTLLL